MAGFAVLSPAWLFEVSNQRSFCRGAYAGEPFSNCSMVNADRPISLDTPPGFLILKCAPNTFLITMNAAEKILILSLLLTYVCVTAVAGTEGWLDARATPCSGSDTPDEIRPTHDHLRVVPQQSLAASIQHQVETPACATESDIFASSDGRQRLPRPSLSSNANRAPPAA